MNETCPIYQVLRNNNNILFATYETAFLELEQTLTPICAHLMNDQTNPIRSARFVRLKTYLKMKTIIYAQLVTYC